MTTKDTSGKNSFDDDFDDDPGTPAIAQKNNPFDDDDDLTLGDMDKPLGQSDYAQIARELSEMDANVNNAFESFDAVDDMDDLKQEFDHRANQAALEPAGWQEPVADYESLQDLTLDSHQEPDDLEKEIKSAIEMSTFDTDLDDIEIAPVTDSESPQAITVTNDDFETVSETWNDNPSVAPPPADPFPISESAVSDLAPQDFDHSTAVEKTDIASPPPLPAVKQISDDFEDVDDFFAPPRGAAVEEQPVDFPDDDTALLDIDSNEDEGADGLLPPIKAGIRIPLIDLGEVGFDRVAISFYKRTRALQGLLQRRYSLYGVDLLSFIDQKCARWLALSKTPYRSEIESVATKMKTPGIYAMNLFFEFGCTTAFTDDTEGGIRLLHTMDWSLRGLGKMVVAVRRETEFGQWINITWPGYIGCLQGIAPGRFAAAINQAPTGKSKTPWINWITSKLKWQGQRDMPPSFLLRRVFEECKDFDTAVAMLEKVPICFPAIFSIVGINDGEFSIIERTETDRKTHKRQTAVTNHWLNSDFDGKPIGYKSQDRLVAVKSRMSEGVDGWDWLHTPVLNPTTRIAMDLNPKTARMRIIGYDGLEPITIPLDIYAD